MIQIFKSRSTRMVYILDGEKWYVKIKASPYPYSWFLLEGKGLYISSDWYQLKEHGPVGKKLVAEWRETLELWRQASILRKENTKYQDKTIPEIIEHLVEVGGLQ